MRFWTRGSGIASGRPALPTSSVGAAVAVAVAVPPRTRPWYADVWVQMLRKKPLGTIGGVIVVVMLAAAVLADVVTPYGFSQTSLPERFIAMNGAHWLGTDQLGRDLLTRLIYGARISLYVGFGAVLIGCVLATAIGVLSAYFGGRFDLWLQRGVDAWSSVSPSASRTPGSFGASRCRSRNIRTSRAPRRSARATCGSPSATSCPTCCRRSSWSRRRASRRSS